VTISNLDDKTLMLLTKITKSITNILNLSPTHFVANLCHQHILLRTFVTNIVVSGFTIWTENGLKLDKKYLVSKIEKLESSERSWIEISFQWDLWNVTFPTSNYPTKNFPTSRAIQLHFVAANEATSWENEKDSTWKNISISGICIDNITIYGFLQNDQNQRLLWGSFSKNCH